MTPSDLRAARAALGMSGAALARELGINPRTLRRYEAATAKSRAEIPRSIELAVRGLLAIAEMRGE
jgi:ribosome-binding protein aMBF1 (putative translation factor)